MTSPPQLPVLRHGEDYESLDLVDVRDCRDGTVLARVGQANAGIVRRDLKRSEEKAAVLRVVPVGRLLEIYKDAGQRFLSGTLPLNDRGDAQSPEDYVRALSATSGLPHVLVRRNMQKVFTVLDGMAEILRGLMRGLDLGVLDRGFGEQAGVPVHYAPRASALGVVLPSNSPGVNSLWLPSIALKVPVVLKPGREEPWTPLRILRALLAAGCPKEALGFYPTDHEGAAAVLQGAGRSLLFGDESTTKVHAQNPAIQIHGPGRSKVLLGPDVIAEWERYLDVLVASVADNGGRSCINASSIFVPAHGDAVAEAMARALARLEPRPFADPEAKLAAFANPKMAAAIDAMIERGLAEAGAEDVTARFRAGPRLRRLEGASYLLPTVVRCQSVAHPLARTEFLFPFTSVVEVPAGELVEQLGPSLVVTAITRDQALLEALGRSPGIQRLNRGPVPTSHVEWNQPHEGNLFEFLHERRAIQRAAGW